MPNRRARLLEKLVDARPACLSGETLAADVGVSRVAVAKHVAALRKMGYTIEAVRGEGYRLLGLPEHLVALEVERLVREPLWVAFEGTRETVSTNDDCKRRARAGAPEGSVVIASAQTGGRGRFGRVWDSPEGGVYLSALLRPGLRPDQLAPLSLVAGVGVADGLATLGVEVGLKWPNDVMLGRRKVGGILLEIAAEADRVEWVVVGCGINVRRSAESPATVAFVADTVACRPAEVAAAVLDGLAAAYREFCQTGFSPMVRRYVSRHTLTGEEVVVRDAWGGPVACGMVRGIDEEGRLLVQDHSGVHVVVAGEVTLGSAEK